MPGGGTRRASSKPVPGAVQVIEQDFQKDLGHTVIETSCTIVPGSFGDALGSCTLSTTSASQADSALVQTGAVADLTRHNVIFEARVRVDCAGTALGANNQVFIGLMPGAAVSSTAMDATNYHVGFQLVATGNAINGIFDDATNESNGRDTGADYVDNTWHTYKIDCTNLADVKLYVDGVEDTGALVVMDDIPGSGSGYASAQPLCGTVQIHKASGTTVDSVSVDYMRIELHPKSK